MKNKTSNHPRDMFYDTLMVIVAISLVVGGYAFGNIVEQAAKKQEIATKAK